MKFVSEIYDERSFDSDNEEVQIYTAVEAGVHDL